MEQYTRMDDVVITGLDIKHQTYSRALSDTDKGEDAPPRELQTLEKQLVQFFENHNMTIDRKNISACHTLYRKDAKAKPNIIVRFANRKSQIELLRQTRKLSGTGVYVNEHLTKKNSDIARQARILKKQNKIQATWTRNCKIMIRLNGPLESAKVIMVREMGDLDPYRQ